MAKTLALTTTPQQIIVSRMCKRVLLKEDESVVGWPTSNLIIQIPDASGSQNVLTAGKAYQFEAPGDAFFGTGTVLGLIFLPSGSTTGIQDEF